MLGLIGKVVSLSGQTIETVSKAVHDSLIKSEERKAELYD